MSNSPGRRVTVERKPSILTAEGATTALGRRKMPWRFKPKSFSMAARERKGSGASSGPRRSSRIVVNAQQPEGFMGHRSRSSKRWYCTHSCAEYKSFCIAIREGYHTQNVPATVSAVCCDSQQITPAPGQGTRLGRRGFQGPGASPPFSRSQHPPRLRRRLAALLLLVPGKSPDQPSRPPRNRGALSDYPGGNG